MTSIAMTSIRELDTRVNDGIHVRLLWCERDRQVSVAVTDTKTGEAFSIEIRDGERAMDVFHHPYAFAAWHGIKVSAPVWSEDSFEPLAA